MGQLCPAPRKGYGGWGPPPPAGGGITGAGGQGATPSPTPVFPAPCPTLGARVGVRGTHIPWAGGSAHGTSLAQEKPSPPPLQAQGPLPYSPLTSICVICGVRVWRRRRGQEHRVPPTARSPPPTQYIPLTPPNPLTKDRVPHPNSPSPFYRVCLGPKGLGVHSFCSMFTPLF